jgi:hypothetical protein
MLRINLLRILYRDDNCNFLIEKLNKDCLNIIGSFLCIGYTLNNETIHCIKQLRETPYTYYTFTLSIGKFLDQYEYLESKLAKIKQSELLYRYINMYYAKIAHRMLSNLTQIIHSKAILLQVECNEVCDEVSKKNIHNYNTRYNSKQRQLIDFLNISRIRFIKEAKESLNLLNNLNEIYPTEPPGMWY